MSDQDYIETMDPTAYELLTVLGVVVARLGGRIEVTDAELANPYHFQVRATMDGYLIESALCIDEEAE